MKLTVFFIFAIALSTNATDVPETENAEANKEKRQSQEGTLSQLVYRSAKQEQIAPVEEPQEDDRALSRADEEYRPGQVFSLNPQELLDLQPERKAPLPSNQYLQHLYGNQQQEHKQNLQQQVYYVEPQSQSGRQAPPSHAVIARPHFSLNGGEASVGAALSVSDSGSSSSRESFNQELLALLGQSVRPQESRPQTQPSSTVQSVAPQYQQIDRYITKPSKKPTKLRSKVRVEQQPQATAAPQQYLIETTNVQQQPQQQQQYHPTQQPQRLAQSLRYVPIQQSAQLDQFLYERERPESQGLKIVPAPKLAQQPRAQFNYRLAPQASQYQQQEAAPIPKQYRLVELPRAQPIRQELRLPTSSNIERPVAYLKRLPEIEKQRSVKIYDPITPESQQPPQHYGEQFVLRPLYRSNEQRPRYEIAQPKLEQSPTKAPHSSIYVSKNIPLRQKLRPQSLREQNLEQSNIELVQHGQSLDEQRSQLPPPKNNKAYTPEEFAALVAAGYSVTPVPVSELNLEVAQSRTSIETATAQPKRRLTQRRRNQYLPVRDDSP